MAKNIFIDQKEFLNPKKRNVFDKSRISNGTYKFGYLYPVFLENVPKGGSVKIDPTVALKFMPMYFPVQTRMRADLHFFRVRHRPLWNDFMDWRFDTGKATIERPWLDISSEAAKDFHKVGGLADWLGVPNTVNGKYGNKSDVAADLFVSDDKFFNYGLFVRTNGSPSTYTKCPDISYISKLWSEWKQSDAYDYVPSSNNSTVTSIYNTVSGCTILGPLSLDSEFLELKVKIYNRQTAPNNKVCLALCRYDNVTDVITPYGIPKYVECKFDFDSSSDYALMIIPLDPYLVQEMSFDDSLRLLVYQNRGSEYDSADSGVFGSLSKDSSDAVYSGLYGITDEVPDQSSYRYGLHVIGQSTDEDSPFVDYDGSSPAIKLDAMPFRAYEAIFNSFYRQHETDPLLDSDGDPVYNHVLIDKSGGRDTNTYELHQRNWEPDFLTSAHTSPQFGAAPLVGVSMTGRFGFQDENGKLFEAQAKFGKDGSTIEGFEIKTPDMPIGNVRALFDIANSGFSINDFRNVNAMTRFVEANIRRGLTYRDQIASHDGIEISYDELEWPDFIGGCSFPVTMNMVSQTVETDSNVLGDYAGQAFCHGSSQNSITCYCDEDSYVIGILSVVPIPNYSQLLPKHLLTRSPFDLYNSEFDQIGLQPITYKEVCPVQSFNAGDSLEDVFGYQRPWYDYVSSYDTVHGHLKTDLRDYLINRVFDSRPELGKEFLYIDPKQVNDVFSVTDADDDKIIGQVLFSCEVKYPISRIVIPSLE